MSVASGRGSLLTSLFFSFLVYAHEMCWKTRAEGVVHIGREN